MLPDLTGGRDQALGPTGAYARPPVRSCPARFPGRVAPAGRSPIYPAISRKMRYNTIMERVLTTIPAHFDGNEIVLDVPMTLEPNARLLVTILDSDQAPRALVYEMMSASAASLAAVWDNDEDAVYDAY